MKNKKFIIYLLLFLTISICIFSPRNSVIYAEEQFNNFSSTSYVLLDKDSGKILTEFNSNEKLPVASICKLMTSLLTLEKIENGEIKIDDEFIASPKACDAEGSQAFLDVGSKYRVTDLLKSVIVASANDSAICLAENIAGNEENFVKLMNDKAQLLNMTNTLYANSTGLNTPNQYSTAFDTTIVLKEIEKFDLYSEFCKIWMDEFSHPSGRITEFVNTNRLIRYYGNCTGGKTGFTDEAGYCLASSASNGNMNLIAVTLNCKNASSRFEESTNLYMYGFANFENRKIIDSSIAVENVNVSNGKIKNIDCFAEKDYFVLSKKGEKKEVEVLTFINKKIKAPLAINDSVGIIQVVENGVVVDEISLIVKENINKQNYFDILGKISDDWKIA